MRRAARAAHGAPHLSSTQRFRAHGKRDNRPGASQLGHAQSCGPNSHFCSQRHYTGACDGHIGRTYFSPADLDCHHHSGQHGNEQGGHRQAPDEHADRRSHGSRWPHEHTTRSDCGTHYDTYGGTNHRRKCYRD